MSVCHRGNVFHYDVVFTRYVLKPIMYKTVFYTQKQTAKNKIQTNKEFTINNFIDLYCKCCQATIVEQNKKYD